MPVIHEVKNRLWPILERLKSFFLGELLAGVKRQV